MDFNWYLNRQGVRGAKGVKGDKGDSPIIEVAVENANEYKLKVVNPDGTTITSPNLRGNKIDTSISGTYVRYNPVTGNLYTDEIDSATTEIEGVVRLADSNDMTTRDELSVITPSALADNLVDFFTTSGDKLISLSYDENSETTLIDTSLIQGGIAGAIAKANGAQITADNANTQASANKQDITAIRNELISITQVINNLPTDYVTTDTVQEIKSKKTFLSGLYAPGFFSKDDKFSLQVNSAGDAQLSAGTSRFRLETSDEAVMYAGKGFSFYGSATFSSIPYINLGTSLSRVLTENRVRAGNNISIVQNADGVTISSTGGGGSVATTNNGIEGDYHSKYGIIDYTGSGDILTYSERDLTVNAPLVLNCAGNGEAQKTTIASAMTITPATTEGLCTVFYAGGQLLECGKVDYSEEEPEDNGIGTYQAWFNPNKTTNPNQQWQFKSNDTGNVWRTVEGATPVADVNIISGYITSAYCFKYRHIDKRRVGNVTTDTGATFKGIGYRFNDGLNIGTSTGKLSASGATIRMTVGSTSQYYNFSNVGITLYGNSYFALGTSYGSYNAIYIRKDSAGEATITNSDQSITWLRSSDVDNQTIQVIDGKLHCNMDELGNEVNALATRVTQLEEQLGVLIQKLDEINGEEI